MTKNTTLTPIKMETKCLGGAVVSVKQIERNGVPIGIVEGYIATFDIDRGDFMGLKDQFLPGAFAASIMEHRSVHRQIRFKDHHGRTIGGFPIESVREDSKGLFGVGEINLEVQQGREAFALAKQGVLTDFSIGFSIVEAETDRDQRLRKISEATIWEGSIVDEPMNPFANITAVKKLDAENPLSAEQLTALQELFDSEEFKALDLGMTNADDPADDPDPETKTIDLEAVALLTEREFEKALIGGVKFSRTAAKAVASIYGKELDELPNNDEETDVVGDEDWQKTLNELKSFSASLNQNA